MTGRGYDEHFRANIKALREAWGLSQRAFASYLGLSLHMVPFWETGTGPNKKNAAKTLGEHLGVTQEVFDKLWGETLDSDELTELFGYTPGRMKLLPLKRGSWAVQQTEHPKPGRAQALPQPLDSRHGADEAAEAVRALVAQGKRVWIVTD